MAFRSMAEIRAANKRAGHHFFDRDTLKFFASKVYPTVYGGRYFITSEKPPHGAREFKVRAAGDNGYISPVSGPFVSLSVARADARERGRSNPGKRRRGGRRRALRGVKWLKVSAVGVKTDRYGRKHLLVKR